MSIDINCDLGESYDAFIAGKDEELLDYVTSINIACGYHAGHHSIMHQIVRAPFVKCSHWCTSRLSRSRGIWSP